MGWKKLPYWLKGGIILGTFQLIVQIILKIFFGYDNFLLNLLYTINSPFLELANNFGYLHLRLCSIIILMPGGPCAGLSFWGSLIAVLTYFVIGALIGLIYVKIKSSKSKK
ncbi:hypothetical protein FJZ19_05605 [Candidatus Pacearchaeota archaeon]|nr:hypothetical protein [Candidatus Pacearchaeota archaeon]